MRCLFVPIVVFMFLSSFTVCEAQQAGPYLGEALRRVTTGDKAMMEHARTQVLEQNIVGKQIPWSNSKSGHSGEVSLRRTFKRNGMSCGEVEYITTANHSRRFSFSFCRTAEGWKFAP